MGVVDVINLFIWIIFMESNSSSAKFKTEYELLIEQFTAEWRVNQSSEAVSKQIFQEIYWADENWKTRSNLTAEHKLKMT